MPLAAGNAFEVFVTIVMFAIGMAGWIGQQLKNRQQGAQPRPAQPKREDRVQDEIERFLSEVTGQKSKGERAAAKSRATGPTDAERAAKARSDAQKERARRDQVAEDRRVAAEVRRQPSGARSTADSRAASDSLPTQRRRPKVQAKVATPATAEPTGPVAGSSLRTAAGFRTSGGMSTFAEPLVTSGGSINLDELRDPASLRKAIILNEIFGRPKSKQSRGESGL